MVLSELKAGESATVTALDVDEGIRRRLQDMGLICGTTVECLMFSPLGDPGAYFIRGAVIALRHSETDHIMIERQAL